MSIQDRIDKIVTDTKPEDIPDQAWWDVVSSSTVFNYVFPFMPIISAVMAEGIKDGAIDKDNPIAILLQQITPRKPGEAARPQDKIEPGVALDSIRFASELYHSLNNMFPTRQLFNIIRGVLYLFFTMFAEFGASREKTSQDVNKAQRPNIIDPESLMNYFFWNPDYIEFVKPELAKHGLSDDNIGKFISAHYQHVPLDIIRNLYHRKQWDLKATKIKLTEHRFRSVDQDSLIKGMAAWPGVQDIIRFAVREVYTPAIAEKFGLYTEFPSQFKTEAEKVGLSEEHAKHFWAAHWELPSVQLAFEMYHRKEITNAELKMLLKAQDYMPYFREKIINVAYLVPARVDIRRMYRYDIIDRDQVFAYYEAQGYNSTDAEFLTTFVETEYGQEVKEIAKSDILSLYKNKGISKDEATTYLRLIRFKKAAAEDIILRVDLDIAERKLQSRIKRIKSLYTAGKKSENETRSALHQLGFEPIAANEFISEWEIERYERVKQLSLQLLEDMYFYEVIDEENVLSRLVNQGYTSDDAELIRTVWSKKAR